MKPRSSRYRSDEASDYQHRFHAGNVGDVWKHLVLVEVLRRAHGAGGAITYVESHAGDVYRHPFTDLGSAITGS